MILFVPLRDEPGDRGARRAFSITRERMVLWSTPTMVDSILVRLFGRDFFVQIAREFDA